MLLLKAIAECDLMDLVHVFMYDLTCCFYVVKRIILNRWVEFGYQDGFRARKRVMYISGLKMDAAKLGKSVYIFGSDLTQ
jgi:hypothetical protein